MKQSRRDVFLIIVGFLISDSVFSFFFYLLNITIRIDGYIFAREWFILSIFINTFIVGIILKLVSPKKEKNSKWKI
ncbi:MAG: hypothetical protein M1505_01345 [Patescibacteria group bacterium]|nr:hypothetical protein [Patescibacteria group bacterium]MCL5257859.1 hypothetical protein [Patescibacteria group bacterium]